MQYKVAIFDLDGTLTDSLADLADATNYAIAKIGCGPHSPQDYCLMIGTGLRNLIALALGEGKENFVEEVMSDMKNYYRQNCLNKTYVYDGIPETIAKLRDKGVKLAVLTNKDQDLSRKIVSYYFGDDTFEYVFGTQAGNTVKPDSAKTLEILKLLDVRSDEAVFVGDSGVDIETAKAANVYSVGVSWGLRGAKELKEYGANKIIDQAEELLRIFD